jgi:hypothetical protein
LWDSDDELAAAGVRLACVGRGPAVRRLLRPMGWSIGQGFTRPVDPDALSQFAKRIARTPGDVLLISNEDLAEAGAENVHAFFATLEAVGIQPRVIVTARDWSKQLPSEYQQLLKHNLTGTYDTFLEQVRRREGVGEQFWLRQDVPGICERWGRHLDPADVHIIPVPAFSTDPEAVYRLFSGVVGFDHHILKKPAKDTNASFGVVEAEVLRRLNVALGDRLSDYENEYLPAVRGGLIRHAIARGASARITLPPEHVEWVQELSEQRLGLLRERGYSLHGDPSLLVPSGDVGQAMPALSEGEMADAAITTLATFVVQNFRSQRARARPNHPG